MSDSKWSWEGIQLLWPILGLIGAALGIGSLPPMTHRQLWTALLSGVVAAALAPQWAAHIYLRWFGAEIPPFMNNTIAFFFGVGGMFIVPAVIVFWKTMRDNPFALIDWLRGRGGAPPASPPPGPGDHP